MAENKTYSEKLKDPRWQKFRLEVMARDGFKCCRCKSVKKTLNVHHTKYIKGREPWEYNLKLMETLCEPCHKTEHVIIAPENPEYVAQLVYSKSDIEVSLQAQLYDLQETLRTGNFKESNEEEILKNILFIQGEQRRLGYV